MENILKQKMPINNGKPALRKNINNSRKRNSGIMDIAYDLKPFGKHRLSKLGSQYSCFIKWKLNKLAIMTECTLSYVVLV